MGKTTEFRKIFDLSWPVMLGMILQSLLGTVDMKFISMLGTEELSAASISNTVSGVIFVMSSLVSAGTLALVSRSYGEGNMDAVKSYSSKSFLLSGAVGAILGLVCFIFTTPIIMLLFKPDDLVASLSAQYLSVMFAGMVFTFLNSALRSILQALGDTRTPLYIFGISNIINAVLDPLFMFPLGLGIMGAALATVLSTIFSFAAINYILVKRIFGSSVKSFIMHMKPDAGSGIRILRIGGWACIQQVARPITGMLMMSLVYQVGGNAGTAAFGAGGQLFNYTFIFLAGLSAAISIMVGQSLGRGDIDACDGIIKAGMRFAMLNMLVFSIPYFIFPDLILRIFSQQPDVIKIGVSYLRIVYVGVIFVIFPTIYGGVFQGAGDTFPPMISSIIANVILKLPLAFVLAIMLHMGTSGVWVAVALSVIIEAVIIVFYFKSSRWKRKAI